MVSMSKVVIGRVSHETNTFSNVATKLDDYDPCYGEEILNLYGGTRTEVGGFIDVLEEKNVGIIPTIVASATPAGPINRKDFDFIKKNILKGIKGARIDGVLLSLHGAMVAEEFPEAEGTLLYAVKEHVGRSTPVICTLDLHAMVSDLMVKNLDAVFGYDTNPHVDQYERGVEAAKTMVSIIEGKLHPVVGFKKLRLMPPSINMRTTEGPMVKLFEIARKMENRKGVINVSVFGGFSHADVQRAGSSVVVVTNGDINLAEKLSAELGNQFLSVKKEFLKELIPVKVAVDRAIKADSGPIVLADLGDNPGGGAPGDGTFILREIMERGVKNVGVAIIKDPEAVEKAIGVGVRGSLKMKIGGKTNRFQGDPVEVKSKVKTITDGIFIQKAARAGLRIDVGRTAVLDVDGIDIILTERSHAPNDPEIFRRNGIDPTDKKILILKSRGHFRAAYEPFSKEVIEVDTPGLTTQNLSWFKFSNIPRPMWPFDEI